MLVTVSLCVSVLAAPAATDSGARVSTKVVASTDKPKILDCDPLPREQLDALVSRAAAKQDLPPELIRAVIRKESASKPCVVSEKGAQGLMQLMPDTAAHFGVRDAFDPKQNVDAGAKFLKQLLTRYDGDVPLALSAYNGGPAHVYRHPADYVSDILSEISKE